MKQQVSMFWPVVAMAEFAILIVGAVMSPGLEWNWTAIGAVATGAAVGVALWLGWREGRWRREAEGAQARLAVFYAVSVRATWDEVFLVVRDIRGVLKRAPMVGLPGGAISSRVGQCTDRLGAFDFQTLSRVDVKAALQLAEVPHLLHILSVFAGSRGYGPGADELDLLAQKGLELLDDVLARLEHAHVALFSTTHSLAS